MPQALCWTRLGEASTTADLLNSNSDEFGRDVGCHLIAHRYVATFEDSNAVAVREIG
jgi:hypothetical protein